MLFADCGLFGLVCWICLFELILVLACFNYVVVFCLVGWRLLCFVFGVCWCSSCNVGLSEVWCFDAKVSG